MSCVRFSSVFCSSVLRSVSIRSISTSALKNKRSQNDKDGENNDAVKESSTSVADLMSALKGLKVDGVSTKSGDTKTIGFSVAAQLKKRKLESKQKAAAEKEKEQEKKQETSPKLEKVQELVKEAAVDVAKTFPDQKKTQSELLQQLMRLDDATTAGQQGQDVKEVSAILSGIRVQKESRVKSREEQFVGQGDRNADVAFGTAFGGEAKGPSLEGMEEGTGGVEDIQPYQRQRKRTLFDRQRLNIFQPLEDVAEKGVVEIGEEKSIWDIEEEKQRTELLADTIRSGFDEMIRLTEEGKLWNYPIDNEQGLEDEQKVPFYEHVFLEEHLEGFPEIPEVRNFMELVLIGLGKNPYLTVKQKKEHIEWFRKYFEGKMDILKESTAAS